MKKFNLFLVISLSLLLCFFLTACEHEHKWDEATCETPKTCSDCGETEGDVVDHTWQEATCKSPKTCKWCELTEGDVVDHTWQEATCKEPKTCSTCKETEGNVVGHAWSKATCQTPKKCSWCGETEGDVVGHAWSDATCYEPKTCQWCNKTTGSALGHSWSEATCDYPKTCSRCGDTNGSELGHDYSNGICSKCNQLDQSYWELASDAYYYLQSVLLNRDSLSLRQATAGFAEGKQAVEFFYVAMNQMGGYSSDLAYFWYDSSGDLVLWDSYVDFNEVSRMDVNDIP
ncbi:MAG: hypothetical protein IKU53_03935 [Firmicutes bacterium]|nr:hypothetical protein [Bacillota bacterium]